MIYSDVISLYDLTKVIDVAVIIAIHPTKYLPDINSINTL